MPEKPDLDALTERYGFPKPVDTTPMLLPGRPLLAAQIDLSESLGDMPRACCCALHGSLHDSATCCPTHRRARAGLDVPAMTPIAAEAATPTSAAPTYDTTLDPISPDFDLAGWGPWYEHGPRCTCTTCR